MLSPSQYSGLQEECFLFIKKNGVITKRHWDTQGLPFPLSKHSGEKVKRLFSHTWRHITSSANMFTDLFPQHKTKTSREIFFFQCLLSIYFLLLPLCLQQCQCSPSPRTLGFCICCLVFQTPEGCTTAALSLQTAVMGLFQRLGEQPECREHK